MHRLILLTKVKIFDIKNYELLIDVNLKGTINCIDVLKNFMKGRNNHISIISSPVGYRGMPQQEHMND